MKSGEAHPLCNSGNLVGSTETAMLINFDEAPRATLRGMTLVKVNSHF